MLTEDYPPERTDVADFIWQKHAELQTKPGLQILGLLQPQAWQLLLYEELYLAAKQDQVYPDETAGNITIQRPNRLGIIDTEFQSNDLIGKIRTNSVLQKVEWPSIWKILYRLIGGKFETILAFEEPEYWMQHNAEFFRDDLKRSFGDAATEEVRQLFEIILPFAQQTGIPLLPLQKTLGDRIGKLTVQAAQYQTMRSENLSNVNLASFQITFELLGLPPKQAKAWWDLQQTARLALDARYANGWDADHEAAAAQDALFKLHALGIDPWTRCDDAPQPALTP